MISFYIIALLFFHDFLLSRFTVYDLRLAPSLRLAVLVAQQVHEFAAALVEPLGLARLVACERVGRDDGQRDGRINITHDRVRQAVWINLSPRDCLPRRRTGKAPSVGPGVRDLQKVVVAALVYA